MFKASGYYPFVMKVRIINTKEYPEWNSRETYSAGTIVQYDLNGNDDELYWESIRDNNTNEIPGESVLFWKPYKQL